MKIIEGNLVLKEDTVFDESIEVRGNIVCEGGPWDIKAWHIKAWDITAGNITAWDISFWGLLFAYYSIKCKSAVSSRTKHAIVCLDGEVSYNED